MISRTNLRIGLVQGFYWLASCIFVSFLVRLLKGYGYSDYNAGIILSISSLATLTVQPMIGLFADRAKSVRRLLLLCFSVAIIGAIALSQLHYCFVLSGLLVFIIFGAFRSLIYIIDLWSLNEGRNDKTFSYGFTRSFGALFYALGAAFFGFAIDRFGTIIIVPLFIFFSLIASLMVYAVKEQETDEKEKKVYKFKESVILLLKNKRYMVLLISYTIIEISSIANQNYLTRKYEELGAGEIYTGLSFLLMGLLQLPSLLMIGKLRKHFSPEFLILVSFIGFNIRNAIMGFATTPVGTMLCYLTEPFAFGIYIGAILYYMESFLPEGVRFFGTTLYSALTAGLGGIIGNYLAGLWAEKYGILFMMKIIAIPALIGFLFYFIAISALKWRVGCTNEELR